MCVSTGMNALSAQELKHGTALEIADDVAFGHVADGLPDAVGGSASTRIGEVGECIPRGRIAAVDVVADEPH